MLPYMHTLALYITMDGEAVTVGKGLLCAIHTPIPFTVEVFNHDERPSNVTALMVSGCSART